MNKFDMLNVKVTLEFDFDSEGLHPQTMLQFEVTNDKERERKINDVEKKMIKKKLWSFWFIMISLTEQCVLASFLYIHYLLEYSTNLLICTRQSYLVKVWLSISQNHIQ